MKKLSLFLVSLFLFEVMAFSQAAGDKIVGVYLTAKKTSQVRIFKATDGKYYGKIAWIETEKEKKDINNPDASKRGEKVWGLLILKGLSYNEKAKQWENGTVYDPDNGKTYDCFLWFDPADPKALQLKGFVLGMRWLGRESTWIKEEKLRE
jgi:uncharacterized protein (DUF2147 family)